MPPPDWEIVPSETRSVFCCARVEDLFNGEVEQARNSECERQCRIVFAGFNRIDRLPGNLELFCQRRLRQIALGTQDA